MIPDGAAGPQRRLGRPEADREASRGPRLALSHGVPPHHRVAPVRFTIIDGLKVEARRAGVDVIDLGFGNPDIPSSALAVDKLCEAAHNTRNHRYSASKGIPKLRQALADLYQRRFVASIPSAR